MKKIIFIAIIMTILSTSIGIFAAEIIPSQPELEGNDLFPDKEIPKKYEQNNEYVQLNNKLVKAMNDFENGNITQSEYLKICNEVKSKLDTEKEMNKIIEEEQKFEEVVDTQNNQN